MVPAFFIYFLIASAPFQSACSGLVAELWTGGICKGGSCNDNVQHLIERLVATRADFDIKKAKVLYILRPQSRWRFSGEPNLVMMKERTQKTYSAIFHIALLYDGNIIDPTAEESRIFSKPDQYFKEMFVHDGSNLIVDNTSWTSARRTRVQHQAERHAIDSYERALGEILVTEIPAQDWNFHNASMASRGYDNQYYYEELIKSFPTFTLREFFKEGKRYHTIIEAPPLLEPEYTQHIFGDTSVEVFEPGLEVGDLIQVPNVTLVRRPGEEFPKYFNRTNRDLEWLRILAPAEMMNLEELEGRVVLDPTMGGGLLVEELREKKVVAFGIDFGLTKHQKKNLLADTRMLGTEKIILSTDLKSAPFIWGDALDTKIADEQVDQVFDFWGIFEYNFFGREEVVKRAFEEWKRVLKIKGTLVFGPVDSSYEERVASFLKTIPGFGKLKCAGNPSSPDRYMRFCRVQRLR